jgi:hypothetical protein
MWLPIAMIGIGLALYGFGSYVKHLRRMLEAERLREEEMENPYG